MNKIYYAGPVLGMLVFAGIFSAARSGSAEREAAAVLAAKTEKENKLKAEAEARKKAVDDAVKLQEARKKERAEKEARELAEQELRQKLVEQRDRTFREQDRLAKQIERLKKDLDAEQIAIAKVRADMEVVQAERAFLAEYVKKAGTNVAALETLLNQINARATRTAAVEAAPKKNS